MKEKEKKERKQFQRNSPNWLEMFQLYNISTSISVYIPLLDRISTIIVTCTWEKVKENPVT